MAAIEKTDHDVVHSEDIETHSPTNSTVVDETKAEYEGVRDERTTPKAWLCIFFLVMTFGSPFWATPTTAAMSSQLLTQLGQVELSAWVVPCITTCATISILIFGANSDLFGRRYFLLSANLVTAVGYIVCACAHNTSMLIAGLSLNGFGSGMAGVALIAVPELIPNKYRHIGVVLADGFVYVMIIIGPVVGRYAIIRSDHRWQYVYWGGFVFTMVAFTGLFIFYQPPKHPRGVPWREAVRGLDWVGAILFTIGAILVLVGMVYTSYIPATDKRVIICLVVGFGLIIAFGLWERFSSVRFPLCPEEIFSSHKGREFAVPFCLTFIIVGFFYGTAVIYPTMLNAFYIDANTSISTQLLLTLPANLALPLGAMLLVIFGRKIGHWKITMIASTFSLVLFGTLLAMMTPYNKVTMITFVTLSQLSYGWAAYLSVTYTQLGVPQTMLGLSGGLAGTARYAGGAVASACYSSAISNGIAKKGAELIPKAALAAGIPQSSMAAVSAAASLGAAALEKIPGVTPQGAEMVGTAYKYAVAYGLRNAALASMAFGVVGIILACFNEDIGPKMNEKIETFLENDALAEKNKFH
ncbi:MFS general substrate transporter [Mytilinidion resinicola]|uniref:MFS general substrate transporter n=1 Tax=Mytilinidion resinicola TaxID=574789 RepID=A0A6A6XZI2_9PEZI|nr:MFS general substrate transporter [Mytilinidion resinicola]KAF2801809.1 MFS general substrate transporter [Mytilinidion resinicola]